MIENMAREREKIEKERI